MHFCQTVFAAYKQRMNFKFNISINCTFLHSLTHTTHMNLRDLNRLSIEFLRKQKEKKKKIQKNN